MRVSSKNLAVWSLIGVCTVLACLAVLAQSSGGRGELLNDPLLQDAINEEENDMSRQNEMDRTGQSTSDEDHQMRSGNAEESLSRSPKYGSIQYSEELARAQLAESEAKLKLAKALKQRDLELQKVCMHCIITITILVSLFGWCTYEPFRKHTLFSTIQPYLSWRMRSFSSSSTWHALHLCLSDTSL
jgi:hypothetical protein